MFNGLRRCAVVSGENSLVSVWYMSSFTLCWLSLLGGLPGFKGFIGKVVYPPFLLWGALV